MANLKELIAQREALEREIEQAQKHDRTEAIDKIRALMAEYGLSAADVSRGIKSVRGSTAAKGGKVAAKYRNSATGDTWSGRGLQPKWLKAALASGKTIDDFAIV